jgi:lipopolysaccharide/colanic/teichoic acid biosynthesis glycosyltransferase
MRRAVTNIIFPNRYFVETARVVRRLGRAEANCVIHFQSRSYEFARMSSVQRGWFQLSIKRIFDIVVALLVLAILSPLFLLAIVLIKLEPHSPVFSVRRKNCYGLNVSVWGFSTETCRESIAHFLVYTGVDRVPSLINVLRGDVSIVGPSFQEGVVVPRVFLEALQNCPFKPGLLALKIPPDTANLGLGQIEADYYYVSHWSLLLDLKILVVHLFSKQTYF